MAIFPYFYYGDSDPDKNRLDVFECVLQIDGHPTHCKLTTTFDEDCKRAESYYLDLSPGCILTSREIAKIVKQIFPNYFTYELRQISSLYRSSFKGMNDDLCPSDHRNSLGRVVLATRILEFFNRSFIHNAMNIVEKMKPEWDSVFTQEPAERKQERLNEIVQQRVNPLMGEFTEYLECVPYNRLTNPITKASRLLEDIRKGVQRCENMNRSWERLYSTLSRAGFSQKPLEYIPI